MAIRHCVDTAGVKQFKRNVHRTEPKLIKELNEPSYICVCVPRFGLNITSIRKVHFNVSTGD